MAIRLIFRTDDAGMAANVGGAVLTTYQTIVIENAEVEALLGGQHLRYGGFCHTQLVGAELTAHPLTEGEE